MHFSDPRIHPYLPSLQPTWTKTFTRSLYEHRDNVPFGSFKSLDEFNWYNGKKPRFLHPYGLYSPGHAEIDDLDKARSVDRMLFERDRSNTFLLVDSGGYQVGTGVWPLASLDSQIKKVIRWQEAIADLAVILEVPTWYKEDGKLIEFDDALRLTNRNLEAYAAYKDSELKFLNPLHGMTYDEGRRWFDKTRWFNDQGHAVGWCFSSVFSNDLHLALKMLLYMIEQEHYPQYLHFLGQGSAASAIVASIMRRTVIRAFPEQVKKAAKGNPLNVTVDASSEFQSVGRFLTIYERAIDVKAGNAKTSAFQIKSSTFDSSNRNSYPLKRTYPDVEGPILGKHDKGVVMGDLLAPENSTTKSKYNVDEVSLAILIAHNVWVKLNTIERMSQLESGMRRIAYGMKQDETYEMADILSRLMHSSTSKGQISDLGETLVACTVGLWDVFRELQPDLLHTDSAGLRHEKLDRFREAASRLFGKSTTPTRPEEEG